MTVNIYFPAKKLTGAPLAWVEEYAKRLKKIRLRIIYIPEPSQKLSLEHLKKWLKAGDPFCILTERGRAMDSAQFSNYIFESKKSVNFIIGPGAGIEQNLLDQSKEYLSLGRMTYPHRLALVMLVEQIYRAETMHANHPYHKE